MEEFEPYRLKKNRSHKSTNLGTCNNQQTLPPIDSPKDAYTETAGLRDRAVVAASIKSLSVLVYTQCKGFLKPERRITRRNLRRCLCQ